MEAQVIESVALATAIFEQVGPISAFCLTFTGLVALGTFFRKAL